MAKEFRVLINKQAGIIEIEGTDSGWIDETLDLLLRQLEGGDAPASSLPELEGEEPEEEDEEEPEPEEEEEEEEPEPEPEEEEEPKPKPRSRSRARKPSGRGR